MADRLQEVIQIVLQTQGREGVEALRKALGDVGDVSADTVADTDRLLDSLAGLNETAAKAAQFETLSKELAATTQELDNASNAALQLSLQLGQTDKPSKEMLRNYKAVRSEVTKLEDTQRKQAATQAQVGDELRAAGFDTRELATAYQKLRTQMDGAASALQKQVTAVQQQADATRKQKQATAEADEAFRKLARSGQVSAEALAAFRARTAAAAQEQRNLAASTTASVGVLSKLKAIAATAIGFVSFRSLIAGIKSIVSEGDDAEQQLGQLQAVLQSTGRQAEFAAGELSGLADKLARTSKFSAGEITNAEVRLLSYTNVAREQFPAAMQVIIDQSARLGIGLEQSAEVVGKALQTPTKAMEALGRQGFVLSDSQTQLLKQLEATGQTAKAQAIIIDLLVESYGGAAAQQKLGTVSGLWQALRENIRDFQTEIAKRGVLDYFKSQITGLIDEGKRLAADGTLGRWAQKTADAIVAVAKAAAAATRFLTEHYSALLLIAKGYAALKIGQWLVSLNALRLSWLANAQATLAFNGALDATATRATRLRGALRSIPTSIKIGVALIGLDLAIKGAKQFGEFVAKHGEASRELAATQARVREELQRMGLQYAKASASLAEYRNQAVLTAEQVAGLSKDEVAAYRERLDGLKTYLAKQYGYLLTQKEVGLATEAQLAQLAELPAALSRVRGGYDAITKGVQLAADALTSTITPAAQQVVTKLEGIDRDANLAAASIKKLFDGLNFIDSTALGDVGLALASIAQQGAGADKNIREGLLATLQQLSGEELLRFQSGAIAAFDALKKGPAEVAAILDTTLLAAMEKLGVSAERMGLSFTVAGKDATAAFSTILENANATSGQIEAAFKAALSKVATLDEAKALGALLRQAGEQGKIGFDQAESAASALRDRIAGITAAISPLADEFGRLGIKSQASLNAARDAARDAFEAIRAGAARGEASIEDVRRAFGKYAEATRAAVADSDEFIKQRAEGELSVLSAVLQVTDATKKMGTAGADAGSKVAGGAKQAADALDGVASSASKAAASTKEVGDAAEDAGTKSARGASDTEGMAVALGGLSDKAIQALQSLNLYAGSHTWFTLWNDTMGLVQQQQTAFDQMTKSLDDQLAAMDPLAHEIANLRSQYDLLDDAQLRAGAEKINQLKQAAARDQEDAARVRQQAEQDAQQQAERARARESQRDSSVSLAKPINDTLTIDWRAPSRGVATSASAAEIEQAERLAELVAPRVLQRIERSRSLSIRRHAR